MDASDNPYSPGAGLRPLTLAGRDEDIAAFETLLARSVVGWPNQNLVLTGLRGVGKTVLLNELADRARAAGWIVAQVEGRRGDDGVSFRAKTAQALSHSLRQIPGRWKNGERRRAALATFKSFALTTDPSGGLSLGIEMEARRGRADTGSLDMDLSELAADLADSAAAYSTGVVVLIDEMQDLAVDELAAICIACHEAGQRSRPFHVVGAGLPRLPGLLAGARPYAERLFAYRPIGALNRSSAAVALMRPAEELGVRWARNAVGVVVEASSGYPYFVQEFAKAAWDYAAGPHIGVADAEIGVRVGRERLDHGFFRSRWNRATPDERDYLRAMAVDGDGPSAGREVAQRLGKRSVEQIGPTRAKLIHKGLIYASERGLIAYTVPRMADFINRQTD